MIAKAVMCGNQIGIPYRLQNCRVWVALQSLTTKTETRRFSMRQKKRTRKMQI
jgi:hypothetical protein